MFNIPETMIDWAIVISAGLLVLVIWCIGVWLWSLRRAARAQKVEERLRFSEEQPSSSRELRLWHDGHEVTTSVPGQLRPLSLTARLQQLLENAGWDIPLRSMLLGVLGITMLVFLVTFVLTDTPLAGVGVCTALLVVLWTYAKQRVGRRTAVFERQFVDALELAARSLRAGHPLIGGFQLVSEEVPAPVGTIFARICQQQTLGVGLDDALRNAAAAHANVDMKLFATSVIIQLESGGNLADMMERLAIVIRERMRLNRHARILTAQTQLSKRVLLLLPFVLFVVLNVLRAEYMEPLYNTPFGRMLLVGAGVSVLLGMWIMNRMVVLRY